MSFQVEDLRDSVQQSLSREDVEWIWDNRIRDLSKELAPVDFRFGLRGRYSDVYPSSWDNKPVAVKVIRCVKEGLKEMRRKVRREGAVWAMLDHQNILPLWGFATGDMGFGDFGAFISPFCLHGNSELYLQKRGNTLRLEQRVALLRDTAKGVKYLHHHNPTLVHGDIKPANVLIDEHGVPKLCDFGLAKVLQLEGSTGLTTTSGHRGTERYLAPELVLDQDEPAVPTKETDIYALGCVGLRFIFLVYPYADRQSNRPMQILGDIEAGIKPMTFPDTMEAELQPLSEVLQYTWNPNPSSRPNVKQFLFLLNEALKLEDDDSG